MPRHPPNAHKNEQHTTTQHTTQRSARDRHTTTTRQPRPATTITAPLRRTRDAHHTGARRTTNQTKKQTNGRPAAQFTIPRPPADARVHYAVHNQPAHNPRPHPSRRGPRGPDTRAHRPRTRQHATPPTPPPRNERRPRRAPAHDGKQEIRRGGGPRAPPHGGEPAPPAPAAKKNPLERR